MSKLSEDYGRHTKWHDPQPNDEAEARAQRQSTALQEIFRRTDKATKYGRTINVHPDQVLLQQIREIAREALQ